MSLYEIVRERGARRLLMLGMTKNAGKTFSLNHLVRECEAKGERLGLTSTGRDGEALDLITGKAKPRIYCPQGTVVATARLAAYAGTAVLTSEVDTGIETVLGEVTIAEVERAGHLELAGPVYATQLETVLSLMAERGAARLLVDGALDRKAAARVLRHVVLAVGAVISRSLDEVVEQAVTYVEQLSIPAAPLWVVEAADAFSGAGAILGEDGSIVPLSGETLLGKHGELSSMLRRENCWGLLAGGAIGDESLACLLELDPLPALVVRNASALFVEPMRWRRFVAEGGRCYATQPLDLLAVTINPYSPEGWELPADEMLEAVSKALAPLPVFNLARQ